MYLSRIQDFYKEQLNKVNIIVAKNQKKERFDLE
jgi:hypothetical protein